MVGGNHTVLLGATGGYEPQAADEGYGPRRRIVVTCSWPTMTSAYCLQPDYAAFFIFLRPTTEAQVFDRTTGKLINAGITIDTRSRQYVISG